MRQRHRAKGWIPAGAPFRRGAARAAAGLGFMRDNWGEKRRWRLGLPWISQLREAAAERDIWGEKAAVGQGVRA